jgi:hypothetical protein
MLKPSLRTQFTGTEPSQLSVAEVTKETFPASPTQTVISPLPLLQVTTGASVSTFQVMVTLADEVLPQRSVEVKVRVWLR